MLEISRIHCDNGEEVKTLDYITEQMIVFNLEALEDGTIIDGKFSVPKFVNFLDKENKPIDWSKLIELKSFVCNNQEFNIKTTDDEETVDELMAIISKIPQFSDAVEN